MNFKNHGTMNVRGAISGCLPAALLSLLALGGCDGADDAAPTRTVMVVDDGFDTSVPALEGRVIASYTVSCDAGVEAAMNMPTFADAKAALLAEFQTADTSCRLREGIVNAPEAFPAIQQFRERWNGMISHNVRGRTVFTAAEFAQIASAMDTSEVSYHGTSTSSTIAGENPNLRLVLIQTPLDTAQGVAETYQCQKQSDLDRAVALWTDPEVHAAYVKRPPPTIDTELDQLLVKFNIDVVNESFGELPRAALEGLQAENACPPVDFNAYFAAKAALNDDRDAAQPVLRALLVHSAGNEGISIDSGADASVCVRNHSDRLVVGADDLKDQRSTFSNFGACVDLYAPGENIVTSTSGGWLMPQAGTSFSSPLIARQISLLPVEGMFSVAKARAALLKSVDSQQRIPRAAFPASFFYDPAPDTSVQSSALISGDPMVKVLSPAARSNRGRTRPLRLGRILHLPGKFAF